jgi:SAM-dependent methyltransferase
MPLSAPQARRVYDRIGRFQDTQGFYECAPVARMIEIGDLARAGAVFELGCGTGDLARYLLAERLRSDATYLGTDISPKMASIAAGRLRPWADRARVLVLDPGDERLPGDDGAFDRFVATYVFDLLDDSDARRMLGEAARLLCPGGRLCLVGITPGRGGLSRLVMSGWGAIAVRVPHLVGGCRPIDASQLIDGQRVAPVANEVVMRWAVSSQIVIAERRS